MFASDRIPPISISGKFEAIRLGQPRAMLTIKVVVDQEDGIDEIDILGSLLISDDESTIELKDTFLDSWLGAFIQANSKLKETAYVVVNTPEELEPFRMKTRPDGGVAISYKNQTVLADSSNAVELALKSAAKALLGIVGSLPRSHMNTLLEPIRSFCTSSRGTEIE